MSLLTAFKMSAIVSKIWYISLVLHMAKTILARLPPVLGRSLTTLLKIKSSSWSCLTTLTTPLSRASSNQTPRSAKLKPILLVMMMRANKRRLLMI